MKDAAGSPVVDHTVKICFRIAGRLANSRLQNLRSPTLSSNSGGHPMLDMEGDSGILRKLTFEQIYLLQGRSYFFLHNIK